MSSDALKPAVTSPSRLRAARAPLRVKRPPTLLLYAAGLLAAAVLFTPAVPRYFAAEPSGAARSGHAARSASVKPLALSPVATSVALMPVTPAATKAPARGIGAAPASGRASVRHRLTQHLSEASLCLSASPNAECQAAFNAALRSALTPVDVLVIASGPGAAIGLRAAQPLHFQKHAPWVRRLETIGKEGIPFMRIAHGPGSEVVVGIDRKGMLGVSLKQTND